MHSYATHYMTKVALNLDQNTFLFYMFLKLPAVTIAIGKGTFIAETAVLLGDVTLRDGVSIFDHSVLRGDMNSILIGRNSNVQDNVTIHVDIDNSTVIGEGVSLGHNCIVHGAEIEDFVIIGMGAIVLNGAKIGSGSVIGAGALVTQDFKCGENSLVMGMPAKIRKTGEEYREYAIRNYTSYTMLRDEYLKGKVERLTGNRGTTAER